MNAGSCYVEANGTCFRGRYTGGRSKRAPLRRKDKCRSLSSKGDSDDSEAFFHELQF
jgi:hypothetical protein